MAVLGGAAVYGVLEYYSNLAAIQHLQPSRGQGDGVTVNNRPDDDALAAMAGFFDEENQIRLIRRNGAIVKKWSLNYTGALSGF